MRGPAAMLSRMRARCAIESRYAHDMALRNLEAVVDELLTLPFPRQEIRKGDRSSGPGFHVHVLQASQDFWDGRDEETVEAAEGEIDAAFQVLRAALTERWDMPETVDPGPYLSSGGPAPEPFNQLCQLSSTMLLWRRPQADRWVALLVGQADPEFPIQLLAAVSDTAIP